MFISQTVGGNFYCNNNQLTSLEFCTKNVGIDFYCSNNQLTSLEFSPQTVEGNFNCSNNQLTSIEFCPQTVGGNFYCYSNLKLKEIQEITDFNLIYLEHRKILANNLSDKLNNELINDRSKRTAKIKI